MPNLKKKIKSFVNVFKSKNYVPIYSRIDNNKLLENKVAFVTGGSGGIGYSISKKLIESGCKVIISGTNEKKLIDNSTKLGKNCKYVVFDLNDYVEYSSKINEIISIFGKVDILVNSAGIHTSRKNADFFNFTPDEYDSILNTNLKSVYFLSQYFSNYFIKNKIKGHILMISSSTEAEPAWSPYRISKWGIKGFTKGLAQKVIKYGIVVNGISPGSTATKLLDYSDGESIFYSENTNNRFVMPEEIAEYALMLVSDLGNMIIGDTIYISGGRGTIDIR